jgi:hypothetical protein
LNVTTLHLPAPITVRVTFRVTVLALLLASAFNLGCSKPRSEDSSAGTAEPPAAPSITVEPSTAGSIRGTVTLEGQPPELRPIDMNSEPGCRKLNPEPVIPPEIVTGPNGGLANVVVYVKGGLGQYGGFKTPQDSVALDQKNCMYEPRIVALMVNQPLEIRNDDATIHNVHVMAKENNGWNKGQRAGGPVIETSFSRPELAIPFMCNVHPWMRAFVFVFAHPYFGVTSKTGEFELKGLPPGAYTIETWHERYGTQDQSVTIGPRETRQVSFRYKS